MVQAKYKEWVEPEGVEKIRGWARDGLNDEQIAHNMGIHVSTLYTWKKKYSEIDESLKKGKEIIDYEVENAMLKRALGYTVEEKKKTMEVVNGEQKQKIETTTKHIAGDVTAQIFWLKNRKPEVWRDRKDMNVSHDKHEVAQEIDTVLGELDDDE